MAMAGRSIQTLVGAMVADSTVDRNEGRLAATWDLIFHAANAKMADNGVGMLSSHSEYKTLTENIRLSLTPH